MSATTPENSTPSSTAAAGNPVDRFLTQRPVWLVGVVAVLVGAVVTEGFALATRGLGVSMEVVGPGADEPAEIPVGGFATAVVMYSVLGILLAVALARWASRPARIFLVTTVALTAVSLVPPFLTEDTDTSTQLVLAVAHLVAAAVIIPALTRRLGQIRA